VLELARSEYVGRRENIIAVGNSGTGKTHVALGLGLAACQKGLSVGFTTAAALVHELHEAHDEKRLLRLQRQLAGYQLLIVDELVTSRSRRPAPSCCSRSSVSATNGAPSSLPAISGERAITFTPVLTDRKAGSAKARRAARRR